MLRHRVRARDTPIQRTTCPLKSPGRKAIGNGLETVTSGKTRCIRDGMISSLSALVDSISYELLRSQLLLFIHEDLHISRIWNASTKLKHHVEIFFPYHL